ncbi:alpha/beta-hydrolase N-terminal domain-containing protein [Streptomyces sp. NPDC002172]
MSGAGRALNRTKDWTRRTAERVRGHLGPDRVVRRRPCWGGIAVAILCYCLSLTPSLLPRAWWLQGLAAGVSAAVGYAVGAVLETLARLLLRWAAVPVRPRVRRTLWTALGVLGAAAVITVTAWSVRWEGQVRRAVTLPPDIVRWQWALVPVVAALVATLLLLVARTVRLGTRLAAHAFDALVARPVAYATGVVLAAFVIVGVVQGFLLNAALDAIESTASLADQGTAEGVHQPGLPTLSGSPESAAHWDTLGAQGRNFVGTATTRADITAFTGRPADDPVRVYVGLRSADTLDERAALAVRELTSMRKRRPANGRATRNTPSRSRSRNTYRSMRSISAKMRAQALTRSRRGVEGFHHTLAHGQQSGMSPPPSPWLNGCSTSAAFRA